MCGRVASLALGAKDDVAEASLSMCDSPVGSPMCFVPADPETADDAASAREEDFFFLVF